MNNHELPYQHILNNAALSMAIYNNGKIEFVNDAFLKKSGFSRDEVIGKFIKDFVHEDDKELIKNILINFSEYNKVTYRVFDADGKIKWLQSNFSVVSVNGANLIIDTIFDITEQKKIEETLLNEERNYRYIFNALDDILFVIDSEYNIDQYNDSAINKLGLDHKQNNFKDLIDPEKLFSTVDYLESTKVKKNGLETVLLTKSGGKIPVILHFSKEYLTDKKVTYIRCIDISDRLKWEKEISSQRNKFRKIFNSNPNAMSINRLDSGVFKDVNKAFVKITGFEREQVLEKTAADLGIITLSEQDKIYNSINLSDTSTVSKIELKTKGEEKKEVLSYSEVINIEDVPHLLIVLVDISEISKAQKDILDGRAQKNAIIDNIPHEAWLKDINGVYITVNKPFADFLRLDVGSILGKTDYDLFPKIEADIYRNEDNQVIQNRKQKRILGYKRKEKGWFETYKIPIINSDNKIIGTTGISNDITNSVNYEISLKQNLYRQEKLTEISSSLNSLSDFNNKINKVLEAVGEELNLSSISIIEGFNIEPVVKYFWSVVDSVKGNNFILNYKDDLSVFLNNDHKLYGFDSTDNTFSLFNENNQIVKEFNKFNIVLFPIFIEDRLFSILEIVKSDKTDSDAPFYEFIKTIGNIFETTFKRFIAEEKIKRSEQRFREFAQMLPEMVYETNNNGDITFANNCSLETLKYSTNDVISIFDIFISDEINNAKVLLENILNGENISGKEFVVKRNDNSVIPVLVYANIIKFDNKPAGVRWVLVDITDQKNTQIELTKAKDDAESASLIKQQFLSTMSHEIRTPLNAVVGITHLLLQEDPKDSQIENLKALKSSSKNLLILINDILDFTKIETGNVKLNLAPFSPNALFNQIHSSFNILAKEKGIELNLEIDPNLPKAIIGDKTRLLQILTNLIGNGIKFTPKGSVTLKVDILEIKNNKANIRFKIIDTGIGIRNEKINHIFGHFTQEASDITREYGGTGLGLAITKRIIEMHNSSIDIESIYGKGSSFFFNLVYEILENQSRPDNKVEDIEVDIASDKKILVVEDNEINRLIISKFLNKWNIQYDHAINGLEAVEKARENSYGLILMDLEMPVMSGYQASSEIRNFDDPTKAKTPIIAISASALLDVQERIFAIGINDYLLKPFNPKVLSQKIMTFFQK